MDIRIVDVPQDVYYMFSVMREQSKKTKPVRIFPSTYVFSLSVKFAFATNLIDAYNLFNKVLVDNGLKPISFDVFLTYVTPKINLRVLAIESAKDYISVELRKRAVI